MHCFPLAASCGWWEQPAQHNGVAAPRVFTYRNFVDHTQQVFFLPSTPGSSGG